MVSLQVDLKGEICDFQLPDGEHSVGRAPQNDVHIGIPTISRRHAMLRVDGEHIFVRDLGSAGGTYLEGERLHADEVEVPSGAQLRFADIVAWHGHRPMAATVDREPFLADEEISSGISYRLSDGFSEPARARIMAMMGSLFELLASADEGPSLEKEACHFVSRWVRADRVVLLEDDGPGTPLREKARWSRHLEGDRTLRVSRTLVEMVMREQTGLAVDDARVDPRTKDHASIVALDIRSAMLAPLFDNERVRGVLYVDTRGVAVSYTEEDLQVLTATANAVAVKRKGVEDRAERRAAVRVQRRMLPERLPQIEGYSIEAFQQMCKGVGGDLYDCLRRPNGNYLIALGDVSGKGTPAALAMGACVVLLRALAESELAIEDLLKRLNRHLMRTLPREPEPQFVTLFLGELAPESGRLVYVSAGHEYPCLISPGCELQSMEENYFPLAWFDLYEPGRREIQLGPGCLLAVFSDGFTEATIDGDDFLGREEVERILRSNCSKPLVEIVELLRSRVQSFLAGHGASDDLTLMLLRRESGPTGTARP